MQQLLFNLLYCLLYGVIVWAANTIVRVVVPYIKTKLESSQYEWAAEIIEHAVRAYEQTIIGDGRGEERYELVKMYVVRELSRLGIELSDEQISTLIEAAVQIMKAESVEPIAVEEGILTVDDIDPGIYEKPNVYTTPYNNMMLDADEAFKIKEDDKK